MAAFTPRSSGPVFQVQVLRIAVMLATGKRTVSAALRLMGWSQETHVEHDHCVLNCAVWSNLGASRLRLTGLLAAFPRTSVRTRGCGSMRGCPPCRSAGCWSAIQTGHSSHKHSCLLTWTLKPHRSWNGACRGGQEKSRMKKPGHMWPSRHHNHGMIVVAHARRQCCGDSMRW